jgi:hypothetical protein
MTAHLNEGSEAVDGSDDAALDAFDNILSEEQDGDPAEEIEEDSPDDGDEPEAEDEEADEAEEQETVIPAPVSFNAEEKAVFATMTPEQQQAVAAIEARRNADVQKATTAAAEAKRNARSEAEAQLAQIQRQYATELEQYAKAFEVQEPDYSLIATNPQAFAQQMAYFKQAEAEKANLSQQSQAALRQAQQIEQQQQQQWEAEQQAILAREIPEWNDPAKRNELVNQLISIGRDLGFEDDALSNVDATELLALRKIATDRDKAEKYDKLMAGKMEAVRAAKGKPAPMTAKPGTAQPRGSGQKRALTEATQRLRSSGSDADALAAFEAMGL